MHPGIDQEQAECLIVRVQELQIRPALLQCREAMFERQQRVGFHGPQFEDGSAERDAPVAEAGDAQSCSTNMGSRAIELRLQFRILFT